MLGMARAATDQCGSVRISADQCGSVRISADQSGTERRRRKVKRVGTRWRGADLSLTKIEFIISSGSIIDVLVSLARIFGPVLTLRVTHRGCCVIVSHTHTQLELVVVMVVMTVVKGFRQVMMVVMVAKIAVVVCRRLLSMLSVSTRP